MATIGIRHLVVAKIKTEVEGSAITYDPGMIMGEPIEANVTISRSDNPLYAGDREVENENGITGISTELNVDDLSDEVRAYMLGDMVVSGTGNASVYRETDDPAPYVGYGYIRVKKKAGVRSYKAFWNHKAQFSYNSESTRTKGETVEWQTPTVVGRGQGVFLDDTGKIAWRDRQTFETEAAAAAWLDGKAGITH